MKEVHFILQTKGGVGKSFCASLLAQYIRNRSQETLHCFDTDPNNQTFAAYPSLNAQYIKITKEGNRAINTAHFDDLMNQLIDDAGIAVVDAGTATFDPLLAYITENGVDSEFADNNVRLIVHVPLNGGQAKLECLKGLSSVLNSIADAEIVVWLNEHKGKIHENGKPFETFKIYEQAQHRIIGTVTIPELNPDTFGKNINDMVERNLTFDEVSEGVFGRFGTKRLLQFRDMIWADLDNLPLLANQDWLDKQTAPSQDSSKESEHETA